MATVNFIKYKRQSAGALSGVTQYVSQEEKIRDMDGRQLVSGQNCTPQLADREFQATRDACRKVRHCVATCLTDRERSIITLRYGLDDRPPRTQREIASRCGISRSYVSRIEKRALEKLEQAMRE